MIAVGDEIFETDVVAAGVWVPGPYEQRDQLVSCNEMMAEKRAAVRATLRNPAKTRTINLGDFVPEGRF